MELSTTAVDVVRLALEEDLGSGDLTTDRIVPEGATCEAELLLKEPGVVCGLSFAEAVFTTLDPEVRFEPIVADGDGIEPGRIAELGGPTRAILSGERTALNLLGRLCGIATLTRRFVDAVEGTGAAIGRGTACRFRSRPRRSPTCARRSRPAPIRSCSTT